MDKANRECKITGIEEGRLIVDSFKVVTFNKIGTDYFILARSTDKLCEEIEGKVPLVVVC